MVKKIHDSILDAIAHTLQAGQLDQG